MRIRIIGGIIAVLLAAVGAFAVILYVQDADRRAAARSTSPTARRDRHIPRVQVVNDEGGAPRRQ